MKVAELMTENVRTCSLNDTLNHAAQLMWDHDCGAVPVVDDDGRTIGIVTDRDIAMAAYTQGKALSEIPASTAASRSLVFAQPADTVDSVHALMQSAQVRRVPVLDGGGRPVGILSVGDIARHVSASPDPIARTLAAISKPRLTHGEVFRVRPIDGGWEVFDRRAHRVSDRLESQSAGVIHAKELARRAGSAQVIVYGEGDKVVSEFVYQRDERSALASDDTVPSMAASQPAHVRRARKPNGGKGVER
jgi:CBS domain-containing protein